MLKNKLFLITIAILGFTTNVYAEEELKTVREIRPNNISVGLDIFPYAPGSETSITWFFLDLEYNRTLNKNFTVGANAKTAFLSNNFNLSGRYYFDWINDKSSAIYAQTDLGLIFNTIPAALTNPPSTVSSPTYQYLAFNPSIGYEFRAENGFTFNVDAGVRLSYNFSSPDSSFKNLGPFYLAPVKFDVKFGYSF